MLLSSSSSFSWQLPILRRLYCCMSVSSTLSTHFRLPVSWVEKNCSRKLKTVARSGNKVSLWGQLVDNATNVCSVTRLQQNKLTRNICGARTQTEVLLSLMWLFPSRITSFLDDQMVSSISSHFCCQFDQSHRKRSSFNRVVVWTWI